MISNLDNTLAKQRHDFVVAKESSHSTSSEVDVLLKKSSECKEAESAAINEAQLLRQRLNLLQEETDSLEMRISQSELELNREKSTAITLNEEIRELRKLEVSLSSAEARAKATTLSLQSLRTQVEKASNDLERANIRQEATLAKLEISKKNVSDLETSHVQKIEEINVAVALSESILPQILIDPTYQALLLNDEKAIGLGGSINQEDSSLNSNSLNSTPRSEFDLAKTQLFIEYLQSFQKATQASLDKKNTKIQKIQSTVDLQSDQLKTTTDTIEKIREELELLCGPTLHLPSPTLGLLPEDTQVVEVQVKEESCNTSTTIITNNEAIDQLSATPVIQQPVNTQVDQAIIFQNRHQELEVLKNTLLGIRQVQQTQEEMMKQEENQLREIVKNSSEKVAFQRDELNKRLKTLDQYKPISAVPPEAVQPSSPSLSAVPSELTVVDKLDESAHELARVRQETIALKNEIVELEKQRIEQNNIIQNNIQFQQTLQRKKDDHKGRIQLEEQTSSHLRQELLRLQKTTVDTIAAVVLQEKLDAEKARLDAQMAEERIRERLSREAQTAAEAKLQQQREEEVRRQALEEQRKNEELRQALALKQAAEQESLEKQQAIERQQDETNKILLLQKIQLEKQAELIKKQEMDFHQTLLRIDQDREEAEAKRKATEEEAKRKATEEEAKRRALEKESEEKRQDLLLAKATSKKATRKKNSRQSAEVPLSLSADSNDLSNSNSPVPTSSSPGKKQHNGRNTRKSKLSKTIKGLQGNNSMMPPIQKQKSSASVFHSDDDNAQSESSMDDDDHQPIRNAIVHAPRSTSISRRVPVSTPQTVMYRSTLSCQRDSNVSTQQYAKPHVRSSASYLPPQPVPQQRINEQERQWKLDSSDSDDLITYRQPVLSKAKVKVAGNMQDSQKPYRRTIINPKSTPNEHVSGPKSLPPRQREASVEVDVFDFFTS